ncbi:unnamed protein product, partial [Staurois parvus]
MLILVCIDRKFFFLWEGACDQHRANQHCPDKRSGVLHPPRAKRKPLQALTSALLNTYRSHKTALTADEKRYLAVYIYYNNCISMFCVLWETRYSKCRVL